MTKFSLDDFDRHIENLRAQLLFLNEGLDATDHNAPDWLATDLLSLRNKSGRLQDDMKRFRDQLENEGLATKKAKNASKRLSIEATKTAGSQQPSMKKVRLSIPGAEETTEVHPTNDHPTDEELARRPNSAHSESTYVVQHIDVTEEVKRRLQESRLRRLMETPSTAQKRKRDEDEDTPMESSTETESIPRAGHGVSNDYSLPTKRVRLSGPFGHAGKRSLDESEKYNGGGRSFKRRKFPREKSS